MSKNSEFNSQNKLWSGRFTKPNDAFVEKFTQSVDLDQKLATYDIKGSIAHANMLCATGVLKQSEHAKIIEGLKVILKEIEENQFVFKEELEDVHMNIESALIEKIGEVGKKLHTARSRNDQVATDLRLYLREENKNLQKILINLANSICDLASKNIETIMPGFTHLQAAQPVSFAHHLLAYFEMLFRDIERLFELQKRINTMPLGSAALAGVPYPIDRQMTCDELGFERICQNSIDAVSDRDFCIEFISACSIVMMHFSRMCEEMILWSSIQFNFIEFDDSYCTGSSIMPQKKNPDIAELVRGKTARVYGALMESLTLMKSQPLAYNRDNQEDKRSVFDCVKTLKDSSLAMIGLFTHMKIKPENMAKSAELGYTNATDLADYLVEKDIPFRDAHKIVGQCVKLAISKNIFLEQMDLKTFQSIHNSITQDVYPYLDLKNGVNKRNHIGGTSPIAIKKALSQVNNRLQSLEIF